MSTLTVATVKSNSSSPPAFQNTSGTEVGKLCRAFVRKNSGFDGLGNGIMSSFNVSSITQISTGRWQVNFTNAMPDTNYVVMATCFRNNSNGFATDDYSNRTTTYCTIVMNDYTSNRYDFGLSVCIFS